jgi:hypothetical protein
MNPKVMLTMIAAALLVAPAGASAESSVYAPDQGARTFASGQAGWTETSESAGTCIEFVLCPQITNSYQAGGGADENGFIRTEVGSLTGAGGTSTGTWASPTFVYDGNGGVRPDSLDLSLARRSDVADLLRVDDNTATFSVKLVSVTSPADTVTVIDERSLAGADDWSRIRDISIDPGQLTIGDKYRIEIATTYRTGVTVVPGGSSDYDDVVMRAKGIATSTTLAGGAGGFDPSQLANSGITGKSATVTQGGSVLVNVRCARKLGAPCKIAATGLRSKRGGKLGKARHVTVRNGGSRAVVLRIKPKFRAKIASAKRIFVRVQVRSHGHSSKKVVKLKLRHA